MTAKKQRKPRGAALSVENTRALVVAWASIVGALDSPHELGVLITATLRGAL